MQDTKLIIKSVLFLYSNNELSKREIRKLILFTTIPKRIKFLEIYLTKEIKNLSSKNDNILIKEIEDDTNNGKIFYDHRLEGIILLECPYYLN